MTTLPTAIQLSKKAEEISLILAEHDVDLWKLRELALTEGGLVNSEWIPSKQMESWCCTRLCCWFIVCSRCVVSSFRYSTKTGMAQATRTPLSVWIRKAKGHCDHKSSSRASTTSLGPESTVGSSTRHSRWCIRHVHCIFQEKRNSSSSAFGWRGSDRSRCCQMYMAPFDWISTVAETANEK